MIKINYIDFLKSKQIETIDSGFDVDVSELNSMLFDWQKDVVKWALRKGKACLFLDTGLGKTICQLDWADKVCKHTGGNVLILAYLTVAQQTTREAEKFEIPVTLCRTQADVKQGINITNYEMLKYFDTDSFIGIVLDESSILKNYMGKTRKKITETWDKQPYKLACTATPSPNNQMEILNQAEFLNIIKVSEALAQYFINDMKTGNWRLKGHAVKDFWEWVSTWAICLSKPSEIGYSDEGYILPKLNEHEIVIPIDETSKNYKDGFFRKIETNATAFHREKKITAEQRAIKCAELVNRDEEQYLIWCSTDYEADLLKKHIPYATEIRGSQKSEVKAQATKNFLGGKIRVLISKVKIFGYGLNFQNCHNTIFCGMDYSYENYYQAVRRFWRFGQKSEVNVYIVIGSTEQNILNVVREKEKSHKKMKLSMNTNIKDIQLKAFQGDIKKEITTTETKKIPCWLEVVNG